MALPALRTMRLLAEAGVERLDGIGEVAIEVYPGPTLAAWHCDAKGYKGSARDKKKCEKSCFQIRKRIAKSLVTQLRAPDVSPRVSPASLVELESRAAETDHVLDALVCAMTAWAARVGKTFLPDGATLEAYWHWPLKTSSGQLTEDALRRSIGDERQPADVVAAEGWIHHPMVVPSGFLSSDPWSSADERAV